MCSHVTDRVAVLHVMNKSDMMDFVVHAVSCCLVTPMPAKSEICTVFIPSIAADSKTTSAGFIYHCRVTMSLSSFVTNKSEVKFGMWGSVVPAVFPPFVDVPASVVKHRRPTRKVKCDPYRRTPIDIDNDTADTSLGRTDSEFTVQTEHVISYIIADQCGFYQFPFCLNSDSWSSINCSVQMIFNGRSTSTGLSYKLLP